MRVLFSYFSMILKGNDFKNTSFIEFEMIRVFVNTLTADYKYFVPDCENLSFPVKMQLS